MTIPRQLAPTVGLAHGGDEFWEGSFLGIENFVIGRMKEPVQRIYTMSKAEWIYRIEIQQLGFDVRYVTGAPRSIETDGGLVLFVCRILQSVK